MTKTFGEYWICGHGRGGGQLKRVEEESRGWNCKKRTFSQNFCFNSVIIWFLFYFSLSWLLKYKHIKNELRFLLYWSCIPNSSNNKRGKCVLFKWRFCIWYYLLILIFLIFRAQSADSEFFTSKGLMWQLSQTLSAVSRTVSFIFHYFLNINISSGFMN